MYVVSTNSKLKFTQCINGTWIDDLSKTSQKKKLANVYIYYVDFAPLNFFHYSETWKLLSCFLMDKYNF